MEGIDEKLNNKIAEDFEGQQFEMSEKKKESRKLLASEIAGSIVKELKPLLEKDTSEKIVEAIKNNKPIVNIEPPIVNIEEKKHEIKLPKIEVPKTVVNLKPNIEVKASEVKIPSVMEVKGFKDFAKLAITILKNKFKIDATKEEPLPVQLVHDNKFYEAISGGGGGPRSVWLKKAGSTVQLNPATEDRQDDIFGVLDDVHEVDHKMLRVASPYALIAEDRVANHVRGSIIGSQSVIGTAEFAILSNATVVQPSADTQMQIVSTSVEDDEGGTGAQEVMITYLPLAWGAEFKTETVVLDGTTPVNTTATDIYRIEEFRVTKASGTKMAKGTITLKSTDAGTLYAQIDAGRNFFERAVHYVRTGYRAAVTEVVLGCSTNGGVVWRLFRSMEDSAGNVVPIGRYSIQVADSTLSHPFHIAIVCSNPNGKRMAVGLASLGIVANQKGTGSCRFYDAII